MSKISAIALLSDFGLEDGYVGIIKGAIAKINPQLSIIDLTHEIPPQQILAARFCLMNAIPYFPEGTVFVAVVDPGVGSQRRGVAIQFAQGYLVGPDNGLFSGVLSLEPAIAAVELTNPQYWRVPDPSSTFAGRDIFAPVGAYLASGVILDQLGIAITPESLVQLALPSVKSTAKGIEGCIQYIDRFGNLITNIPSEMILSKNWSVKVEETIIPQGQTYSEVTPGKLVALIGSHGWLEIAVNQGNAQSRLNLDYLSKITILINF